MKSLAEVLRHTFRSHDLIGRLGGDEFLVFVKGIENREILDRRMDQLFSRLNDSCGDFLFCSAGICFVSGEGFDYQKRSNAQIRPCMRARRREKEGTAITKKWKI